MNLLLVGLGGSIGAILRYLVGAQAESWMTNGFPIGTFTVNVLGSFAIGLLWYAFQTAEVLSESARVFFIVGLLGSFTTFSAFSNDTIILLQNGQVGWAILNVIGQVALCLLATWAGLKMAATLW